MFEDKGSTRITLNAENILITDGGVMEVFILFIINTELLLVELMLW